MNEQNKKWIDRLLRNTVFYKRIDDFFIALRNITIPSADYPLTKLKQIHRTLYLKFATEHRLVWNHQRFEKERVNLSAKEIDRIYRAMLREPVYSTFTNKEGVAVSNETLISFAEMKDTVRFGAFKTCVSYHQLLIQEEKHDKDRTVIPLFFFLEYPRGTYLQPGVAAQFQHKRVFAERAIRETGFSLLNKQVSIETVENLARRYDNLQMTKNELKNSILFVACEQACLRYDNRVIDKRWRPRHGLSTLDKFCLLASQNYHDYLTRCSQHNREAMTPVLPYIQKKDYHNKKSFIINSI